MAPATRSIAGTSNNEDGGVNERFRSLEESLAQVTKAMQEMVTMNQRGNGNGRNQNQNLLARMTKVEFPKFLGDDVKGWIFRCEKFFSINEVFENQKAYHPQRDGQTKVVNGCLEGYLRCMTGEHPKEWIKWLPLAELWYNTNFHTSIHTTPFEVVYGKTPLIHVPYMGGLSKVDAVDRSLLARENVIKMLKFHLQRSQNRMKQQANKSRTKR
uniref:Retrotransposable element Tf2 n=1 Tax=Tanacetum cinerariifolium TaxID=118510 RepID=A0A6L2P1D2_TANCI|nr:retrotransposable element Tf2 [Tanacetum cinerariifolium]